MTDFRIHVIIDPRRAQAGTRVVDRELKSLDDRANRLRATLARAFAGIGIAAAGRALLNYADTFTLVQNRLRTVTDGQEELGAVTQRVFEIANRTRQAYQSTAEVYARTGLAARELGRSQEELLQFTESLNQAVVLSGAASQEARAGLIQLSQGLASGALRGDELRSVLEQLPVVADVIAKSIGVTRGELRELGAEGKISAEIVLDAFRDAREELQERFGEAVPTVGQAFEVLRNQVIRYVGSVDQSRGITRSFSQAILDLSNNVESAARVVGFFATLLVVDFARRGVGAAISALGALRTALLANPLTLLPALVAVGISALVAFGDQVSASSDGLATLQDVAVAAFDVVREAVAVALDGIAVLAQSVFPGLGDSFDVSLRGILSAAATASDAIVGVFFGAFEATRAIWNDLPSIFGALGELAVRAVRNGIENLLDFFSATVKTIAEVIERVAGNIRNIIAGIAGAVGAASVGNADAAEAFASNVNDARKQIENELTGFGKSFTSNLSLYASDDFLPTNELSSKARETGAVVSEAFAAGFASSTGAQGLVDEVFSRAEDRARERAGAAAAPGPDAPDLTAIPQPTLRGAEEVNALDETLEKLRREAELLMLTSQEREVANDLLRIEQQLRKAGVSVSDGDRATLEAQLRANQALSDQADLLEEVRGPMQELERRQAALNQLQADGRITAEEYAAKLRELEVAQARLGNSFEDGIVRGLDSIERSMLSVADQAERTLVNAFQSAEDALVQFVTTGEADFAGLVQSILADVTRLLVSQALQELANLGGGGGGAGGGSSTSGFLGILTSVLGAFAGGAASGATTQGNEAFLVGEEGPEIFRPQSAGRIIPNDESMRMLARPQAVAVPPPAVNVSVVNVSDPQAALDTLESSEGEQRVLNVIRKNRGQVKDSLA